MASWKGYAQMAGRPFDPGLGALSIEDLLTAEQLQAFKRKVSDTYTRYDSLQLPTPYEDQHRYGSMVLTFDEVQAQLSRRGQSLVQNVFLATLPSGDVNAIVAREPYTNTQIVFFEQGLFQFLRDFARLIGGITIPLTPQQLRSDAALAQLPRRYTMPVAASEYFIGMLGGYVVEGTPLANSVSLPLPTHNMFTTLLLSSLMERFVMAHELAHVMRGHLNKKQAKKQEYEADAFALALVIQSAQESPGSWAVGFWACDLVLTALHYLYKAIGLMAFGPDNLTWISQTHPDPLSRRARLRENASRVFPHVPQVGLDAAGELCGMTDGLLQGLWNMCSEIMFLSVMAGKRPSPMWNDWIKMNIKVKDYTYGDILIDILGESIGVKRHRRVKK